VELRCRYEEKHRSRRARRSASVGAIQPVSVVERDRNRRDQTFPSHLGYRPSLIFLLTHRDGVGRMSPSNYERLPQEGAGSGTPSTTNEHQPTLVLCDPRLTTARALSIHQALKTRMNRFLQKENSRSLGMVERAGYAEPDVKVRLHRSASD
jgi:hypothetical protein